MKYLIIIALLFPLSLLAQEKELRVKNINNVFTPNNDGANDFFIIENMPEGSKVTIYNRWGNIMTEWDAPNGTWDGTIEVKRHKREEVPAGVYSYSIKFNDGKTQTGMVTLIR